MDRYCWEEEVLGERVTYPGHPVVLACMVMHRYPDLETALRREPGKNFSSALADDFIPGSGCAVHAALDTLLSAQTSGLGAAYAHAERYWDGWERQHANNVKDAARGREQAARVKARFEAQVKVWGSQEEAAEPDADPFRPGEVCNNSQGVLHRVIHGKQ